MSRSRSFVVLVVAALSLALPGVAFGASALYWIDTNFGAPTLNRADPNGMGVTTVNLAAGSLPEGLAVSSTGHVLWTEAAWSSAQIMTALSDFSSPTALVTGQSVLRGIAVDDVSDTIYWTTSNLATGAFVYRKVGNGPATPLIALPAGANPRGIAVDRQNGKLLWADAGLARIYKANLDGTLVEVVAQLAPRARPWGVAIDAPNQWVYWTEYINGRLARSDYSGAGFATIWVGLTNPTYLARDASTDLLYWTEGAGAQRLRRSNTNSTGLTTLPPSLATYGGIAIGPGETTAAEDRVDAITEFALDRPWPTPAAGSVHLSFALPREARLHLEVFDVQGRKVAVLADAAMPAGRHQITWDGHARGQRVGAGIYFSRMTAAGRTWVQRLVMTK